MKICPACAARYASVDWTCPQCRHQVERREGIPLLAPALADAGTGFDPALFAELARLESGNFWFRARNRLIQWALCHYFGQARSVLEIGCGTGFVMAGMKAAMPALQLTGSEVFYAGLLQAMRRLPEAELLQMDARRIPFEDEFDVLAAFDVLEHIEEDEAVLAQMRQALRPGGGLLLTVPQHQFLWSHQDERAHHVRRYSRAELRSKVLTAGFTELRSCSFVSLLLPLMYVARRRSSGPNYDPLDELRLKGLLNTALETVLDIEVGLIRRGVSLPFGGSLLMVARAK